MAKKDKPKVVESDEIEFGEIEEDLQADELEKAPYGFGLDSESDPSDIISADSHRYC